MRNRVLVALALAACASATPALAQDKKVEASILVGWTFSDGVSGNAILAGDGNVYDRIDPKDSFKWGLDFGVMANENVEVGFLFGQQMSKLTLGGTTTKEVGDLTISTYHGYVAYNFGEASASVRPYAMIGLGATNFGSVDFTTPGGVRGSTGAETQFSTTWGAGVKFWGPSVGARVGIQWTPTYIKSDSAGWWCDPYWGCYVVGNAQVLEPVGFLRRGYLPILMRMASGGDMKRTIVTAVLAVLLAAPVAIAAQKPVTIGETVTETFTITAIDKTSRVVTLTDKDGFTLDVLCGPDVQRFDALKVGDKVTFRYHESLVTAISRPGDAPKPASSSAVTRTPGTAPGGTIAQQHTATVTIEAIDPKVPSVSVKTEGGSRMSFKIDNAKNLEGYKVGDKVNITYTQALAVSVK